MANVLSILSEIENLSLYQQKQILALLEERLISGSQVTQITKDIKEMRFYKGKVCPHCKGEYILINGKYNKQRYIFKNCNKTFSSEKESIRVKNFIVHSYTKIKEFKNIQPIFI